MKPKIELIEFCYKRAAIVLIMCYVVSVCFYYKKFSAANKHK